MIGFVFIGFVDQGIPASTSAPGYLRSFGPFGPKVRCYAHIVRESDAPAGRNLPEGDISDESEPMPQAGVPFEIGRRPEFGRHLRHSHSIHRSQGFYDREIAYPNKANARIVQVDGHPQRGR